ncbi:MAG: hypothetical protein ACLFTH_01635 [Candidatus Woesearchaeota archaeon]
MDFDFLKKQIRLKRLVIFDLAALFVLIIAITILDFSLALGKFQGLIFSLFTMYASFAIFIINGIISLVYLLKDNVHVAKEFVIAGIIMLITGFLIAFLGGHLIMI